MADDALMRKEAEMGRLTREQLLPYIQNAKDRIRLAGDDVEFLNSAKHDLAVHEMALQALSLESVREEALEEAAKVCEDRARALPDDPTDYSYNRLLDAADAIRALQHAPARVAEPFDLRRFVNAADIGGADAPHTVVEKLQAAINRASSAPESPAKEQPGEQKLGQGWIPVSGYAEAQERFGGEGVRADKHSNAFVYFVDSKTQWFAVALPPPPERL